MTGLVPVIHAVAQSPFSGLREINALHADKHGRSRTAWMAGTSPATTETAPS
jgi:hypothetical protein